MTAKPDVNAQFSEFLRRAMKSTLREQSAQDETQTAQKSAQRRWTYFEPLLGENEVAAMLGMTVPEVRRLRVDCYEYRRQRMFLRSELQKAGLVKPLLALPPPDRPRPPPSPSQWVYFIRYKKLVKIGWARDPFRRIKDLQIGSPVPLEAEGMIPGGVDTEHHLHSLWAKHRVEGEWFHLVPEIAEFIKTRCQRLVTFTRDGKRQTYRLGCAPWNAPGSVVTER